MDLTAAEVERLFEELGMCGVTLMIQVEQSLIAVGKPPWEILVSGPAVPPGGIQVGACSTFRQCLESGLRELRESPGDWGWLDVYLQPGS